MASDVMDVSTLTVADTSIGLSSASPTKAAAFLSGARQALIIIEDAPVYMRSDGDAATSADVLLNVGDVVQVLTDNANKTLDNLRFIRKTSTSATLKILWYSREAVLTGRIIRGSVRLIDESGATIEKAEDAAHSSGDKGIMALGVRRDAVATPESGTDGDYTPPQFDKYNRQRVNASGLFGTPFLAQEGNGVARWEKGRGSGAMQHGTFGWRARLFGGTQTGSDWAGIEIPVADMPLSKLASIAINYNNEVDETYSIGVMITITDPNERDSRAELSLYTAATGGHTPPDSAQGHNYYEVLPASTGYFWYGENCTGAVLTEGLPNIYTIAQFQADAAFSTYVITKIEINVGWAGSGQCDDTWVEAITINGEQIPIRPDASEVLNQVYEDISKTLQVREGWLFGEPTLQAANNGSTNWCQGMVSPLDQKSPTGWLACLYGGIQTGDDWARINIPVNEMPLGELSSAQWTYYMSAAESFGVNMVIWVHDPDNFDNRAEITQLANIATLEKANAWNKHVLVTTTDQFFFYGEGTTGTGLSSGATNLYGLDDFQADAIFKNWTIYRITFEYGWESGSNEFTDAWVADIKINGEVIPLKPDKSGTGRIARRYAEGTTGAVSFTIAPKTPFMLRSLSVHAGAALATGELLTITKDCGIGTDTWGDAVIFSDDLFIGSRTSIFVPFGEGWDFPAEDELDVTQANGGNQDLSIIATYQTVFA